MRSIFLIFLLLCRCLSSAQNLISNPGFESATHTNEPAFWSQPKGEFYHYEVHKIDTDGITHANRYHGLCLIRPLPSEFLRLQLKRRLEPGKNYVLKFKSYIKDEPWNKPALMGKIEMAVLPAYHEVSPLRTRIIADPDITFRIDTNAERPFWQYHAGIFNAKQAAGYFYIGKFCDSFYYAQYDSALAIKNRLMLERQKQARLIMDTFAGHKLEMPEPSTKRQMKKQVKLLQNYVARNKQQRDSVIEVLRNYYNFKLDSVNKIYIEPNYFHVRIYFDDFCLAELNADSTYDCSDSLYEKPKPKFEKGKIYALRNINFRLNRSLLLPESYRELDTLLKILREYPGMEIQINGHTDSINSDAYNLKLSMNRARACVNYLIKKGIDKKRLRWKGYGERQPVASNHSAEGRYANRRVEFVVLKVE